MLLSFHLRGIIFALSVPLILAGSAHADDTGSLGQEKAQSRHGENAAQPLRLNDVQVIGSHNSYRPVPTREMLNYFDRIKKDAGRTLNYGNLPLDQQLDAGVRQIELDIFADPIGGRFLNAVDQRLAPRPKDKDMERPGFKVMHVPGIDTQATCSTFKRCLSEIRNWSAAHPHHLPIYITVDAKDEPFKFSGALPPLKLASPLLSALDAEIRSVFSPGTIITPDNVRADFPTLRDAVLANAWPLLEESRGKVVFIFDVRSETADRYREGHPSLAGRAMFSLYDPAEPEAATVIFQDPRKKEAEIAGLVRQGFIIRTRSDASTLEARKSDYRMLHSATVSGAQLISTDYYPGAPNPQKMNFRVELPGNRMFRCNPVRQPGNCSLLE